MAKVHPIFSNTAYNIASTAVSFLFAYVMTPVILSRLGSEDYGIWVFLGIFSINGYFSLLDFGFQGAATKYVAEFISKEDDKKLGEIINSSLLFFLLIGVIGAIVLFIINIFFLQDIFNLPPDKLTLIRMLINITAVSFIFQFPALGYSAIIQGVQRYDYLRGVTIVTTIISNLVLYFFLREQGGLTFIIITMTLTAFSITVLYALITKKLLPQIKISYVKIKKDSFKLLSSLSSKLFASKIVGLIFNNTDKILIGIFLTVFDQTQYDIVNKLHIILLSLLSIVNQAVLPASSEFSAKQDESRMKLLLLRATKYSGAIVLPSFLILMIFPSNVLTVWIGPEYAHLASLVQLYSSHIIFTMLVGVSSAMFIGTNHVGKVLMISVMAALLNLGISIGTVSSLGIKGLIFATVASYIFSSLIYIIVANKTFKIKHSEFFKESIAPLILPTAVLMIGMIAIHSSFTPTNIFTWVGFGLLAYIVFFVIFYATGSREDERYLIKRVVAKITGK